MDSHKNKESFFGFPFFCLIFFSFLAKIVVEEVFLGSGTKGPMSGRTLRGNSRRPSILLSVCPPIPPPPWPSKPQVCSLRPDFGPLSPQISPFRP